MLSAYRENWTGGKIQVWGPAANILFLLFHFGSGKLWCMGLVAHYRRSLVLVSIIKEGLPDSVPALHVQCGSGFVFPVFFKHFICVFNNTSLWKSANPLTKSSRGSMWEREGLGKFIKGQINGECECMLNLEVFLCSSSKFIYHSFVLNYFYFLLFSNLADALIQSDLQIRKSN